MAKQVDQEQRRRMIADALWRVAEHAGLDGASVRRVAAEAGVSPGLVQHYFRTREQMLLFALESAAARMAARYDPTAERSPQLAVRELLTQFLPLDGERRAEGGSLFTFLAEAARGGPIGQRVRMGMDQVRRRVTADLTRAGGVSEPQLVATTLLALTDGLAAHVLAEHLTPDQALAILERQLDVAFLRSAP